MRIGYHGVDHTGESNHIVDPAERNVASLMRPKCMAKITDCAAAAARQSRVLLVADVGGMIVVVRCPGLNNVVVARCLGLSNLAMDR